MKGFLAAILHITEPQPSIVHFQPWFVFQPSFISIIVCFRLDLDTLVGYCCSVFFFSFSSSGHETAGAEGAHDGLVPVAPPHAPLHAEPGVLHDGRGEKGGRGNTLLVAWIGLLVHPARGAARHWRTRGDAAWGVLTQPFAMDYSWWNLPIVLVASRSVQTSRRMLLETHSYDHLYGTPRHIPSLCVQYLLSTNNPLSPHPFAISPNTLPPPPPLYACVST